MHRSRNDTLDIIKLFASYMVVFIHVLFYGTVGITIDALARFSVPLFFLVSGFYSYQASPDKIKHRLLQLLRLLLLAGIVYTCYNVLILLLKNTPQEIVSYFRAYIIPRNLLKLIIFNAPIHTTHLWYLYAAVYVYCLLLLITICKIPSRLVYILSAIALLLHLFLGEVLSVFNVSLSPLLTRNFALMGFPFFVLGMLVNQYYHKFANLPNILIFVFIILGIFETLLSRYLFGKKELYLGSIFILVSLVLIFIKYPSIKYPSILLSLTSCSTYIYIFHPMIASMTRKIYTLIGFDYASSVALQMIHPVITCVLSTIFAFILVKLVHSYKSRKQDGAD